MRHPRIIAACLGFAIIGIPLAVWAAESTYSFALANPNAQQKVYDRVDAFVDKQAFYIRPFARDKLKETNRACKTIDFTVDDDSITYMCDGVSFTSPRGGARADVTGPKGQEYVLSQKMRTRGDVTTIEQDFESENGMRHATFTYREAQKTLGVDVKVTSPKIEGALRYSLDYKAK